MNFSLYIAKRYAFSKSKSKAINIITAIASLGIVVGAMAMFVVLSVFSGLRDFSLSFTNDLDPQLKVFSQKGKTFVLTDAQLLDLHNSGSFQALSRVVEERVLFLFKEKQIVANLKGVDQHFLQVSQIKKDLLYGSWIEENSDEVVVGLGVSYKLSMGLFDTENAFNVYAIKPGKGVLDQPENAFNKRHLTPTGIYSLRNDDLDEKYVFSSLQLAQEVLELQPDQITNLEVELTPGITEAQAIASLHQVLGDGITVKNRMQLNDSLYKMLNTENLVVYLIFTLVVIIALFNLIGALIMIILEKQPNVKTLHNLGVRTGQIRRVFLLQGMIISFLGGFIGIALGSLIVFIQQKYGLLTITDTLAYPVVFSPANLLLVSATILVLGFLASYLASSRVNKKYLS